MTMEKVNETTAEVRSSRRATPTEIRKYLNDTGDFVVSGDFYPRGSTLLWLPKYPPNSQIIRSLIKRLQDYGFYGVICSTKDSSENRYTFTCRVADRYYKGYRLASLDLSNPKIPGIVRSHNTLRGAKILMRGTDRQQHVKNICTYFRDKSYLVRFERSEDVGCDRIIYHVHVLVYPGKTKENLDHPGRQKERSQKSAVAEVQGIGISARKPLTMFGQGDYLD